MATQAEYTVVANAYVVALQSDINTMVPSWAQGMIPAGAVASMAGQLAKIGVDTLDAYRATEPLQTKVKEGKMLQGYKTLIVSAAIALAGVLQAFNWATVIPQDKTWTGIAMLVVGGVMAGLRYVTTTPIGKSQ